MTLKSLWPMGGNGPALKDHSIEPSSRVCAEASHLRSVKEPDGAQEWPTHPFLKEVSSSCSTQVLIFASSMNRLKGGWGFSSRASGPWDQIKGILALEGAGLGRRGDRDEGSRKRMSFLGDLIQPRGCFEFFIHYLGFSCPCTVRYFT